MRERGGERYWEDRRRPEVFADWETPDPFSQEVDLYVKGYHGMDARMKAMNGLGLDL